MELRKLITRTKELAKKTANELSNLNEKLDKVIEKVKANPNVNDYFKLMDYEEHLEHYSRKVDEATDEESCHLAYARYTLEKMDCLEDLLEQMSIEEKLDLITID